MKWITREKVQVDLGFDGDETLPFEALRKNQLTNETRAFSLGVNG